MDEEKAKEILGNVIEVDGGLHSLCSGEHFAYTNWFKGDETATLDGEFTADQLEAIAWWIRNKKR